jgi:hypothetical protein
MAISLCGVAAPQPPSNDDSHLSHAMRVPCLAHSAALTAAGGLLAVSLFLPYWELRLVTPAHPGPLRLVAYLGHLDGPVEPVLAAAEVPSARPLLLLSELERSLALATGTVICFLMVAAALARRRWAALLALPACCFPLIVVADTARWLAPIVEGLTAAAGAPADAPSLLPFCRLVMSSTMLEIRPGAGLALATVASLVVVAGLRLQRRAGSSSAGGG